MIRPHVKVDAASSWALGWQVFHGKSGDVLSHGGDNPGFKAFVVVSVARKSGWVTLMNGDNAGPIIQALVDERCPLNEVFAGDRETTSPSSPDIGSHPVAGTTMSRRS